MNKETLALISSLLITVIIRVNYFVHGLWRITLPFLIYFIVESVWGVLLGEYLIEGAKDFLSLLFITVLSMIALSFAVFLLVNTLNISSRLVLYTLIPVLTFLIKGILSAVILEVSR